MTNYFTDSFDRYACVGDTIETEFNGLTLTARIEFDTYNHIDDDNCHNPDQSVTGCDDKQFAKLLQARQAWFDKEWFYCGVVLSVSKNGIELEDCAASLWGIECNYPDSDNSYLSVIANDLAEEAIQSGTQALIDIQLKLAS